MRWSDHPVLGQRLLWLPVRHTAREPTAALAVSTLLHFARRLKEEEVKCTGAAADQHIADMRALLQALTVGEGVVGLIGAVSAVVVWVVPALPAGAELPASLMLDGEMPLRVLRGGGRPVTLMPRSCPVLLFHPNAPWVAVLGAVAVEHARRPALTLDQLLWRPSASAPPPVAAAESRVYVELDSPAPLEADVTGDMQAALVHGRAGAASAAFVLEEAKALYPTLFGDGAATVNVWEVQDAVRHRMRALRVALDAVEGGRAVGIREMHTVYRLLVDESAHVPTLHKRRGDHIRAKGHLPYTSARGARGTVAP